MEPTDRVECLILPMPSAQPRVRRIVAAARQAAGLLGTGLLVWYTTAGPRARRDSLESVALDALLFAAMSWAVSAAIALAICGAVGRGGWRQSVTEAFQVSRTAVWFAPACILLSNLSPMAVAPALAVIFGVTRTVYAHLRVARPAEEASLSEDRFQLLPSPSLLRALGPALAVSFGVQAGFIAAGAGLHLLAAVAFSAAASMLTLMLLTAGVMDAEDTRPLPRSAIGLALSLILAAGLTTVHIVMRYPAGFGLTVGAPGDGRTKGPIESARALMKKLSEPEAAEDDDTIDQAMRVYKVPAGAGDARDDVFPGVVLKSEVRRPTMLTARRSRWQPSSLDAPPAEPLSIPFSGEYWMFRPPYTRPPRTALTRSGSPAALFYRTTDHHKMQMEAHQRLERPTPMSCCGAIRIVLLNADEHPGTVLIELTLLDHSTKPPGSVSLGLRMLRAWPTPNSGAVTNVLEFPAPGASAMRQFDELKVTMHRDPVRSDRSARVAVDRFLLTPRGD